MLPLLLLFWSNAVWMTLVFLASVEWGSYGSFGGDCLWQSGFFCSTGVVYLYHSSCVRIAQQYLSCALVRGRGIVFCCYYQSVAKSAVEDFEMVK